MQVNVERHGSKAGKRDLVGLNVGKTVRVLHHVVLRAVGGNAAAAATLCGGVIADDAHTVAVRGAPVLRGPEDLHGVAVVVQRVARLAVELAVRHVHCAPRDLIAVVVSGGSTSAHSFDTDTASGVIARDGGVTVRPVIVRVCVVVPVAALTELEAATLDALYGDAARAHRDVRRAGARVDGGVGLAVVAGPGADVRVVPVPQQVAVCEAQWGRAGSMVS